jgi:hypothetical protein
MLISRIAVVSQRIPIAGKIESINTKSAGKVKVRNDASGIATVRIVTASGFDLRFERAGVRGGIIVGRLGAQSAPPDQEEGDQSKL